MSQPQGPLKDPEAQQEHNDEQVSSKTNSKNSIGINEAHSNNVDQRKSFSSAPQGDNCPELTVCDIIRDWGPYQWSLCLFASMYSATASLVVVFGPLLTPAMGHTCKTSASFEGQVPPKSDLAHLYGNSSNSSVNPLGGGLQQCFKTFETDGGEFISQRCTSFIYDQLDEERYGLVLTNKFDLVCDQQWLRSLVSSASLAGMLLSSVTLGLLSDKFGRLRCIQLGFVISCLANVVAIMSHNYYLFCVCIMAMSFAQVGAANALCTMLMEATSPRFRFVPAFEYGIGWGAGMMLAPQLTTLTHDYRWLMGIILAWQLLMLPWLHWGVFESIRWLLSEGHFNRAQIELRRAYRLNRVATSARLAQDIASLQAQQVRKASRVIEAQMAPVHLARALGTRVDETARELDMLSAAIKQSFFGASDDEDDNGDAIQVNQNGIGAAAGSGRRPTASQLIAGRDTRLSKVGADAGVPEQPLDDLTALSPSLARVSFSLAPPTAESLENFKRQQQQQQQLDSILASKSKDQLNELICNAASDGKRESITTQGLIQLAIKYSKTVQRSDEGNFFLVQMFHRKLWRHTAVLLCISVMYETSYYGFLQANKFVGHSVNFNYLVAGLAEWLAAVVATIFLANCSRKLSLITTTLIGSLVCIAMALSYQLIPDVAPHFSVLPPVGPSGESMVLIEDGEPALEPQEASKLLADLYNATEKAVVVDSLIDNEANLQPINSVNLLLEEIGLANTTLAARNSDPAIIVERSSPSPSPSPSSNASASGSANASASADSGGATFVYDSVSGSADDYHKLIELRHTVNFYLMHVGKFTLSVGIQVAATIALEVYPNNLRQTGSGAILLAGRTGSILAPFLYNDPSADKWMLKLTLVTMAAIGLIVCIFVPIALKDNKDKELCDQMAEIEEEEQDDSDSEHNKRGLADSV